MTYVYFLISNGDIVYIGQTRFLQNRIGDHVNSVKMKFNSVTYFETDHYGAKVIERYLIGRLRPIYNKRVDWKDFEMKTFKLKKATKYKEKELL